MSVSVLHSKCSALHVVVSPTLSGQISRRHYCLYTLETLRLVGAVVEAPRRAHRTRLRRRVPEKPLLAVARVDRRLGGEAVHGVGGAAGAHVSPRHCLVVTVGTGLADEPSADIWNPAAQ